MKYQFVHICIVWLLWIPKYINIYFKLSLNEVYLYSDISRTCWQLDGSRILYAINYSNNFAEKWTVFLWWNYLSIKRAPWSVSKSIPLATDVNIPHSQIVCIRGLVSQPLYRVECITFHPITAVKHRRVWIVPEWVTFKDSDYMSSSIQFHPRLGGVDVGSWLKSQQMEGITPPSLYNTSVVI